MKWLGTGIRSQRMESTTRQYRYLSSVYVRIYSTLIGTSNKSWKGIHKTTKCRLDLSRQTRRSCTTSSPRQLFLHFNYGGKSSKHGSTRHILVWIVWVIRHLVFWDEHFEPCPSLCTFASGAGHRYHLAQRSRVSGNFYFLTNEKTKSRAHTEKKKQKVRK